ncbi:Anaphase promoting complex subunit 7 [Coemansia sp. RSA 1722]|nr:Anaphase promoting complex subunit 7 [Coemansia sp. RSA 486]KAJ2236364.1 Anaphase promoting complex subunit 7 [Coemansia sp. RSA 485]KAJ2604767.1 Anaphase promoting complex subunit 7 [Coemansia sp. RSA 1722]
MSTTQTLVNEVHELLNSDLNDSALQLAELECKPLMLSSHVPVDEKLQLLRIYSQCLNKLKQHRASLRAITDFVSGPTTRAQLSSEQLEEIARDIAGIRWNLNEHDLCLAQLRQIPKSHRTIIDLARMARSAAMIQSTDAEELYAELLRMQPNATEAYTFLQARRKQQQKIEALDGSIYHDVASLATARSLMQRLEYRAAAAELQRLARRRHRGNARIVALAATCHFMLNEVRRARMLYERARMLDPGLMDEMATYAELLAADRLAVYALGNQLLKTDQARPEGWIAMARYFLAVGQTQEALAIVWKAQGLAPDCAEAYCTEGAIQMAADCPEEAAEAYLKGHELARNARTFRGVVQAYVRCSKFKEAFVYAKEAAELMPKHAGALALVGIVLSHSPESSDKAARLLQAALDIDCRCTEAVGALASMHVAAQRLDAALGTIEKYLPDNESEEMYTRYADVLTLANELPKAAANYTTALTINPDYERARVGWERVDKLMHPGAAENEEDVEEDEHEENDAEQDDADDAVVDDGEPTMDDRIQEHLRQHYMDMGMEHQEYDLDEEIHAAPFVRRAPSFEYD